MRKTLSIAIVALLAGGPAWSASSVWIGPGADFTGAGNWSAGVPTDIAEFNSAAPTQIAVRGDMIQQSFPILNTLQFNPGAAAYTLDLTGGQLGFARLDLAGAGVVNNSPNSPNFIVKGGQLHFLNSAAAGNAVIANDFNPDTLFAGFTSFEGASTADHATITNGRNSSTSFSGTSTAGDATITNNGGSTSFLNNSTAGNAVITTNALAMANGVTSFQDSASGGNASFITNAGGTLDISGLATNGTTAGSIAGAGTINLGAKSLAVGSNNSDTSVSGIINGAGGSLIKNGNGTLTLSGANTYTGNTLVNAGVMNLIGSLAGAANVGLGGTLMGTGSLGALSNSGAITPGAGTAGVLRVASYSGPGSLNIGFDGASHNALQVAGNADVSGGTLNLGGARFTAGEYSVLNAGTLTGTFATVNKPSSAFLNFNNRYTPTDVFVDISENGASFQSVAATPNQTSVATALDSVRATAPLNVAQAIDTLTTLSAAEARAAYNQISGDALASFQAIDLRSSSLMTHQMNKRVRPAGAIVTAQRVEPIVLAYNGDLRQLNGLSSDSPNNGVWVRGVGLIDHTEGNAAVGSPEARAKTGGFQGGYDHTIGDHGLLGISAGYAKTTLDVPDRSSSGQSLARQGGLYGSYMPAPWFFNASLGLTQANNDMTRSIGFAGSGVDAHSRFKSCIFSGFAEAGYAFKPQDKLSLEPSVSLEATHIDQNGFTETGAPGFNLAVDQHKLDSLVSSLGLRLARLFLAESAHPMTFGVRGAWLHEYRDINNKVAARLAEAPAASFTVQGTPQKRNAAAFGLDARAALAKALDLFASYSTTLSSGKTDHGLLGGLALKW